MSVAARREIWARQYESSTLKLLALALAEYADSQGFCWPSVQTLAEHIGMDVDYTHKKIKRLIALGDILHKRGGGRGRCSIYCVVAGRSDDERSALALELSQSVIRGNVRVIAENTVPESSVSESPDDEQRHDETPSSSTENTVPQYSVSALNTVPENTVLQNTVLQSAKHCTGVWSGEGRSSAPESAKTTQKSAEIDHDHDDDDDDATRTSKKNRRRGRTPPHVTYLSEKGMGAAHLFWDLDPAAAVADFDNRIADGWEVRAIVNTWKIAPPAKGRVYERHVKNSSDRSVDRPATAPKRASGTQQRDENYYTKRSR